MESMITLALIGLWFLAIILILGFFAGARRIGDTSGAPAVRSSLDNKHQAPSLSPSARKTA